MSKDRTKKSLGQRREERPDALVRTIEKKYGVDLKYRSDQELHTELKKEGVPSLSRLLKLAHGS